MAITKFRGEYRFLSNFYGLDPGHVRLRIPMDGQIYPTVEHAYVAAKVSDPDLRAEILALDSPSRAKRFLAQRDLKPDHDFDARKLEIMRQLVERKFEHPELAAMLLATGTEELIEGNTWNDTFWGVNHQNQKGLNHLGRILMDVRSRLRGTSLA